MHIMHWKEVFYGIPDYGSRLNKSKYSLFHEPIFLKKLTKQWKC